MKDKIISFIWQHVLLIISLYVMTLGVVVKNVEPRTVVGGVPAMFIKKI